MAGINSLGIGSQVLTADVLDKLRAADEASIIKPLENKITLSNQKDDAYKLLDSLMTTFKSSASTLSSENTYLGRAVSGNTDAVTITAESGSDVSNFNITNVSIAQKDVWNAATVTDKTKAITDLGSGTFSLTTDGNTFDVDYTSADTLETVRDKINEAAGDKVTASILQTGESSYELTITSDTTNQAITFSDTNDDSDANAKSLKTSLNLNNIQPAKEATFDYNGITITRSTNEISDLLNGVKITLNQDQAATDNANISIAQNTTAISSEMSLFVSSYNALISNLDDMTKSDRETGAVGIFNGESFVKSISREISSVVTEVAGSNGNSLIDYGIDIDRHGVMSLNTSTLNAKIASDPSGMELFFRGDSTTDGVFTTLNDKMNDYLGYKKLMSNFSDQLKSEKDSLVEQHTRQTDSLDNRYEILQKKFIAYDAMISRINSQFSSLQMMIDAEANSKNN
ncbi:flagellar filament capping protein FliD [Sulfurimonas autotrophica]|uniref:Flagellar hook-associated protein 2 n=1 Tax=Sulfurimonas autotrophica (strain ATCC BAA-671 / DSM 16294 / JCM 11897 / OK10) TaxID=563040 RepID=E0UT90_SULAO|nr:flagellar filament capping protein FliD [Sulfurimonas autotrophica]ADN08193.1 flagellar hook-associated 2 domain protein [Sulfurimonas autotrophica DSM 16294]